VARLQAVERRAGTRGPYERPRLSKDYLRGEAGRERVYVHGEGFYADPDIELHLAERRST
jgi:NAD(P)H-nitrite reductase large subunit